MDDTSLCEFSWKCVASFCEDWTGVATIAALCKTSAKAVQPELRCVRRECRRNYMLFTLATGFYADIYPHSQHIQHYYRVTRTIKHPTAFWQQVQPYVFFNRHRMLLVGRQLYTIQYRLSIIDLLTRVHTIIPPGLGLYRVKDSYLTRIWLISILASMPHGVSLLYDEEKLCKMAAQPWKTGQRQLFYNPATEKRKMLGVL